MSIKGALGNDLQQFEYINHFFLLNKLQCDIKDETFPISWLPRRASYQTKEFKSAVIVVVALANFLSVWLISIPSLLSTSPHESAVSISGHGSKQEDPALCMFMSTKYRLFMEFCVLIGLSGQGYQKMYFSLLLHKQGQDRDGLLTNTNARSRVPHLSAPLCSADRE